MVHFWKIQSLEPSLFLYICTFVKSRTPMNPFQCSVCNFPPKKLTFLSIKKGMGATFKQKGNLWSSYQQLYCIYLHICFHLFELTQQRGQEIQLHFQSCQSGFLQSYDRGANGRMFLLENSRNKIVWKGGKKKSKTDISKFSMMYRHVYMYVWVDEWMYGWMDVWKYGCMYVRTYVCMCICICICIRILICICVCDICAYACMYVCMYVRTHARTYVCMHGCMYVCVCMCMCVYLFVCLYVSM